MAEIVIDTIVPPKDGVAGRNGRWGWFRFELFAGSSDAWVPTRRSFGPKYHLGDGDRILPSTWTARG